MGESECEVNDRQRSDTQEQEIEVVRDKHNSFTSIDSITSTNANNHANSVVTAINTTDTRESVSVKPAACVSISNIPNLNDHNDPI